MIKNVLTALTLIFTSNALASDINIALNEKMVEASFSDKNNAIEGTQAGFSVFYNEDNDVAGTGLLKVMGTPGGASESLQMGIAIKVYGVALNKLDKSFFAMALGAGARFKLPAQVPITFNLEGYYAPDITTSGLADGLNEIIARAELEIMSNAKAFVGHRTLKFKNKGGGNYKLDDDFHVGIQLTF